MAIYIQGKVSVDIDVDCDDVNEAVAEFKVRLERLRGMAAGLGIVLGELEDPYCEAREEEGDE